MRPGTRSSAQSYNPSPEDERNSDYATSPPEGIGVDYDGREAVRLQRFETNQYIPGSVYSPMSPLRSQSINADTARRIPHQTSTPTRQSASSEVESANIEETSSLLPRSSNKPNLRDGRVRIRPRGCSLVSFILACLSLAFLGLVAHSFLNLQRDPKGCKMSFMYPSYAKLTDFDTEHTRFATKYSLYLYREQNMDVSLEVFHFAIQLNFSRTVYQSFSYLEMLEVIAKFVPLLLKPPLSSITLTEIIIRYCKMESEISISLLVLVQIIDLTISRFQ